MKRLVLVFLVVGAGASLLGGMAAPAAPAPSWFAGVWQTSFGAMKITQTGAAVKAKYGSAQPNTLTGTVSGRTLRRDVGRRAHRPAGSTHDRDRRRLVQGRLWIRCRAADKLVDGTVVSHAPQPAAGTATDHDHLEEFSSPQDRAHTIELCRRRRRASV